MCYINIVEVIQQKNIFHGKKNKRKDDEIMLPSRMFFDDLLSDVSVENKMKCDIYEKDNKVIIEMDVPGYTKDDIKVECNKGNIVIKAEKEKKEEETKKYLHRERRVYGKIERSFHLEDIDEDSIIAEFKDGILKIEIGKIDEDQTKKFIEIK
ncbi:MAG: Hsp20/alpha crystallin family protein [Firmicutes bacterium]|nr:Hsp20/alpha crystallin family protein [Bacillota bacterium]